MLNILSPGSQEKPIRESNEEVKAEERINVFKGDLEKNGGLMKQRGTGRWFQMVGDNAKG